MPETKGAEYESVESCSLCSGKESELLFYSRDLRFGLPGDFPVVRCQRCKLIRLGKRPKRESMQSYYPTDYPAYLAEKPDERTWKSLFRNWITNHLLRSQYDGQIAQLHASNASLRILDVGCGAGQALDFYKRFGWNASAVEPSEIAAQRATEHGHAVFCGNLQDAQYEQHSFHVVRVRHVLEHIPDFVATLLEINRVLRDHGMLVMEAPNSSAFWAKVFGRSYWQVDSPRHCYFFTQSTITRALDVSGFRIEKRWTSSTLHGMDTSLSLLIRERVRKTADRDASAGPRLILLQRLLRALLLLPNAMLDCIGRGENIIVFAGKKSDAKQGIPS
jgi:SAM-dependent methyltransferase